MTESDARQSISADLVQRLRHVCAQWPQPLFDEMIARLTDITLKYDRHFATTYDRRRTDRLVKDLHEALERSESLHDGNGAPPRTEPQGD